MIYTTDIIGDQLELFIKSLVLGIIFGGCYDFVRFLRTVFRFGKKLYIASDFLYCLWVGFLMFSFLLNENFGIPRFFIFLGAAVGFLLWYFSIGKITVPIAKFFRKVIGKILFPFIIIFRKIIKIVKKRLYSVKIICEKSRNKRKSLLKNKSGLVYNILCLNVSKAFSVCGEKAGKEPIKVESNGTEKTEKGIFPEDRSYCLRGISSYFYDLDSIEHKPEEKRT